MAAIAPVSLFWMCRLGARPSTLLAVGRARGHDMTLERSRYAQIIEVVTEGDVMPVTVFRRVACTKMRWPPVAGMLPIALMYAALISVVVLIRPVLGE